MRSRKLNFGIVALSVATISTLVGALIVAPSNAAEKRVTIAIIAHGDGGSFWSVAKKGALAAGKETRSTVTWYGSNNDAVKQAQLIEAAITKKVSGIAVSVPNYGAIKAAIAKAIAAGIPVVTLNSGSGDFEKLGAITHVGQDEKIAGNGAGKQFKAAGAKNLLCVIHETGNSALEDRCGGAKETFGGTVTNLYVKGNSDPTTTVNQVSAKLTADKTIDAVLSLDPDIALNVLAAKTSSGSTAKIGTFDLSANVVAAIKAGTVMFAVDQQQYLQGYLAVSFLVLNIKNANTVGGGLPVMTGPGFVTKANAATVEALAKAGTR